MAPANNTNHPKLAFKCLPSTFLEIKLPISIPDTENIENKSNNFQSITK